MSMIRLTIQLRDEANKIRLTEHHEVTLAKAPEQGKKIIARMSHYHEQRRSGEET